MDHCQVVMGVEQGLRIRSEYERLMKEPCPCSVGKRCPLRPPVSESQPEDRAS